MKFTITIFSVVLIGLGSMFPKVDAFRAIVNRRTAVAATERRGNNYHRRIPFPTPISSSPSPLSMSMNMGNTMTQFSELLTATPVCPAFGEPGWAPFCFLNGNPIFNAFDSFQGFIQNDVVLLHDFLHDKLGIEYAYGPSIILFTIIIRLVLSPVTFKQLETTQKTQALKPKIDEIKEKFSDVNVQNQMTALLYQETEVNPLAGCLPALLQVPVFISLYRSFTNLALAKDSNLNEPFLWLPDLTGPVYGERSTDWLTKNWQHATDAAAAGGQFWDQNVPPLGWDHTISFLILPAFLVIAQSLSLKILSPESDDPAIQRTQRFLKYLPLLLGYFALSVPAGLALYWVINNFLSTAATVSIKKYFELNPPSFASVDLDNLANSAMASFMNPAWGYRSEQDMIDEAVRNYRPEVKPLIPASFDVE